MSKYTIAILILFGCAILLGGIIVALALWWRHSKDKYWLKTIAAHAAQAQYTLTRGDPYDIFKTHKYLLGVGGFVPDAATQVATAVLGLAITGTGSVQLVRAHYAPVTLCAGDDLDEHIFMYGSTVLHEDKGSVQAMNFITDIHFSNFGERCLNLTAASSARPTFP